MHVISLRESFLGLQELEVRLEEAIDGSLVMNPSGRLSLVSVGAYYKRNTSLCHAILFINLSEHDGVALQPKNGAVAERKQKGVEGHAPDYRSVKVPRDNIPS